LVHTGLLIAQLVVLSIVILLVVLIDQLLI
jgi:hypothetical protein